MSATRRVVLLHLALLAALLGGCASPERAPIPEPAPVAAEPAPPAADPSPPAPVAPPSAATPAAALSDAPDLSDTEAAPEVEAGPVSRQMFPGVRLVRDAAGRQFVEVDAFVPIMDDPHAPDVYLELIMCRRDTRDHEVLVATDAKASHIHAALLLLGLADGQPGRWTVEAQQLVPHPPTGDGVSIELVYDRDGAQAVDTPSQWVKNLVTGERLPDANWLFAGSVETEHPVFPYSADGSGNVIGLTTFGDEVVAYPRVISPEAAIEEPVWVADFTRVPPFGTPVVVRIIPRPD